MTYPLYRILEVCLYSLLNFIPFLLLALYPFRDQLRFSHRKTFFLILVLTFLQIGMGLCASFWLKDYANILTLFSTLSYMLFYFAAVKKPFGQLLFTILVLSNIANFVVMSAKCLEGIFFPEYALQPYRFTMSLFMILIEFAAGIPVFLFFKKIYTPAVAKNPSGHEWNYLWVIPVTFYLIWYYILYGQPSMTALEIALNPRNAVVFLFINAGALLVYSVVCKLILDQDQILSLSQKNHQLQVQTLQYEKLQERINDARYARHDLRHHMSVMLSYVKEHDYESLEKYLNQYIAHFTDDSPLVFCENTAANSILHYYSLEAKKLGIEYSAQIKIPLECMVGDSDLVIILGNLLENALDACQTANNRKKVILIRGTYKNHSLCITVDNSFDGTIRQQPDGTFLSVKHAGAGLGIASVRAVVSEYHGVCNFEWKDGMFYASLICFE